MCQPKLTLFKDDTYGVFPRFEVSKNHDTWGVINSCRLRPEKRAQVELSINSDIKRPLHQALVTHVIPKLLDTTSRVYEKIPFTSAHSEELGKACVSTNASLPEIYVKTMLAEGHDIESLYLDAIPHAARLFHDWWYDDDIDFIQVTQGIFRLEQLIYGLSVDFVMGYSQQKTGSQLNALLVKPAGSHHSLGLLILSQYFRRYGWHVFSTNQFAAEDMVSAVRSEWVDLIGVSLSEDKQIPDTKKLIARLRQNCSNPKVQIMVGGSLLRSREDLVELLDADFGCLHADQAQSLAIQHIQKNQLASAVRTTRS